MPFQCSIQNFLAAKEVKFTVAGFTLIKGESSSGKSSSLKAIYAAMTNTFSPTQIRWGERTANIKLRFEKDGAVLEVIRPKSGSPLMRLAGQEFNKMARAVPQEVEAFLNIGQVKSGVDTVSLNFMSQFQPPLLHAFSHKRIAELVSSSSALDDYNFAVKGIAARREQLKGSFNTVDSSMTTLKESINKKEAELKAREGTYLQIREAYKNFKGEDGVVGELEQVKSLQETSLAYAQRAGLIKLAIRCIDKLNREIAIEQELSKVLTQNAQLSTLIKIKVLKQKALKVAIALAGEYELSEIAWALSGTLQELEMARNGIKPNRSKLQILESATSLKERESQEGMICSTLEGLQGKLRELSYLSERIQDVKSRLKEGVCPYCGNALNLKENHDDDRSN